MSHPPVTRRLLSAALSLALATPSPAAVTLRESPAGRFTLLRDGSPFTIRGAGGTSHLRDLVKYGGNSIRTWGIESLDQQIEGKPLLDFCQELGLTVTVGIWVGHERHGFDYSNEAHLTRQRDAVRAAVRKYRNHPALLLWGLGNEMEGPQADGRDARIWRELNTLAGIVKAGDPNHPVLTVIAGTAATKVRGILDHYPNLDILGVNAYSGASGAARAVREAGWTKPMILTEFGPRGHWEVPKTRWDAPLEPSSRDKAAGYYATLALLAEESATCLGSYAFLWGQKQEVTATWYGMFLPSGEKLPAVDAACRAWTGRWPANRCPRTNPLESPLRETEVPPATEFTARLTAEDPEADPLTWEWSVVAESTDRKVGGDAEAAPPAVPGCILRHTDGQATVRTPATPGNYRLCVIVRDGKGNASTENTPFRVAR